MNDELDIDIGMTEEELIQSSIEQRIKDDDIVKARLVISPKSAKTDVRRDETIRKIKELFKSIGVDSGVVDNALGSFDLNRNWLETEYFDACIEYDGVYPIKMNPKDIAWLQNLDYIGEIRILAYIKDKDGTEHPNY